MVVKCPYHLFRDLLERLHCIKIIMAMIFSLWSEALRADELRAHCAIECFWWGVSTQIAFTLLHAVLTLWASLTFALLFIFLRWAGNEALEKLLDGRFFLDFYLGRAVGILVLMLGLRWLALEETCGWGCFNQCLFHLILCKLQLYEP